MTGAVGSHLWWYLARASGIVAWFMLAASMLWGIVLATDLFPRHRRPSWLLATHRWVAALSLWFLAIHLGALVADSYTTFGVADLLVPFASSWKPVPVAAGVLALWLLVGVQVTSYTIRKARRRLWHGIHLASYAAFWLASLHGTFAGTDATRPIYTATSMVAVAAVVAASLYRLLRPSRTSRQPAGAGR